MEKNEKLRNFTLYTYNYLKLLSFLKISKFRQDFRDLDHEMQSSAISIAALYMQIRVLSRILHQCESSIHLNEFTDRASVISFCKSLQGVAIRFSKNSLFQDCFLQCTNEKSLKCCLLPVLHWFGLKFLFLKLQFTLSKP